MGFSTESAAMAALDAKRTAALESLAALTGGNVLPWLSEDVHKSFFSSWSKNSFIFNVAI